MNQKTGFIELKMTKQALVFLAEGAEEMETLIVVRRSGVHVTLAGGAHSVTCSRHVRIVPDTGIDQVSREVFDAVVVPVCLKGAEACANVRKRLNRVICACKNY